VNTNRLLILAEAVAALAPLCDVAKSLGFECELAATRSEFRRLYAGARPALVVLDLATRAADCVEIVHFLAHRESRARVLLWSGADPGIARETERIGLALGLHVAGTLDAPGDDELEEHLRRFLQPRLELTAKMVQAAFEERQIALVYQPKIDVRTRRVSGVEALARWELPGGGALAPRDFFRAIARERMLGRLVLYTAELAMRQVADWGESLAPEVAVNLAPELFTDADLPKQLAELARRAGIATSRVVFELPEEQAMEDPELACEVLAPLRALGFRTALDDFGKGFSSLRWLHRLGFTELKLDPSLTADLAEKTRDLEAHTVARAACAIAHSLGLSTCAEGVEDAALLGALAEIGCAHAQGHGISRALPVAAFPAWAARWSAASHSTSAGSSSVGEVTVTSTPRRSG
jgi:EAL domain-containing protein (putative c-di-GMP-specific phosphodiesterase class I)